VARKILNMKHPVNSDVYVTCVSLVNDGKSILAGVPVSDSHIVQTMSCEVFSAEAKGVKRTSESTSAFYRKRGCAPGLLGASFVEFVSVQVTIHSKRPRQRMRE
jgi:hypothetical protein